MPKPSVVLGIPLGMSKFGLSCVAGSWSYVLSSAFGVTPVASAELAEVVNSAAYAAQSKMSRGLSVARRFCIFSLHVVLSVMIGAALWLVPVWGLPLRVPLYFVPGPNGTESISQVDLSVASWTDSLALEHVVDVDFELTISTYAYRAMLVDADRAGRFGTAGTVLVSFELGGLSETRPLVFPPYSQTALACQEWLWLLPQALGLVYDEHSVRVPLKEALPARELTMAAARSGAKFTIAPGMSARRAEARFAQRPQGAVGKLSTCFSSFVAITSTLAYLLFFRRGSSAPAPHSQSIGGQAKHKMRRHIPQLGYVEVEMLGKALSSDGSSTSTPQTLALFEEEDRNANGGALRGKVPLDVMQQVALACVKEWEGFGERGDLERILKQTQLLEPASGGILDVDGGLEYRMWLAASSVSMLSNLREMSEYSDWLLHRSSWVKHTMAGSKVCD